MSSGKGGGGSSQYNIYGTIAGAVGVGPFHRLTAFEVDDEVLWSADNVYRHNSPNPFVFTVPGRGKVEWYWGTEDQPACPVLQPPVYSNGRRISGNTLGHEHPPYAGIGYFVLVDFLFGLEKTMAPGIRVFVEREPQQTLIAGLPSVLHDNQANPIAFAAEVLTNERAGLGWGNDMLVRSTWQQAADAAHEAAALTGVSVRLDKQNPAKAAVVDMLDMLDGYIRSDVNTGLLELGIFTPPEKIDTTSLRVITSAHLTANPEQKPQTWEDVITRWVATYADRDKNFNERSLKYDEPRARFAGGSRRPETLGWSHIVRAGQVRAKLSEHAGRRSTPGNKITLSVLEAPFADLRPGMHVMADIDPFPGGKEIRQVCRVTEIVRRKQGDLKLTIEAERTLAPDIYIPPIDDSEHPQPPDDPVADITNARFFECPPALAGNENYHVAALVSRPADMVTTYRLYYDSDPADLFPMIGGARNYALRARLTSPVGASLATPGEMVSIPVELLDPINREVLDENPGATAARDDTLLMFVLRADAGSGQIKADAENKAWLEVFSVVESIATAENRLDIYCYRARRGTAAHEFSAGDEVWFIRRSALAVIGHADFETLAANNAPAWFKLQPGEQTGRLRPLEDCAPRQFTFALARDLPEIADAWHLETRYRYQDLKPAAPVGDTPAGWSLNRPETGSGVLWSTQARKRDGTDKLLGTWSDPVRVEGRRTFYQGAAPDPVTTDVRDGDHWFNTGDNNKLYRWNATAKKWEGLFGLEANAFFTDEETGITYIKEAMIQKVSAGKITSGTIETAEITLAGEGAVIKTDDYEPGYRGSMINGKGAEFDRIIVRDTLVTGSLGTLSLSPWFAEFDNSQAVSIIAPAEVATIRYTLDGRPPGKHDLEWPVGDAGFAPLTITSRARVRARGFALDGRMTEEAAGDYIRNIYQVDYVSINLAVEKISGSNYRWVVSLSCVTPGRKIFFRVHGFSGISWVINNVGGPTTLGGGTQNTGWYELSNSTTSGYENRSHIAVTLRDSQSPSFRIWAYAVVPGMTDSFINTHTYDPQGRAPWLWGA